MFFACKVDPRQIADALIQQPIYLEDLPKDRHGLYALYDHKHIIRYVGETADTAGFRGRIYNKHVTGSIHGRPSSGGRSHKFASEYIPSMGRTVAAQFARANCGATFYPISGRPLRVRHNDSGLLAYKAHLRYLEAQVVGILRAQGIPLDWNV